ncbi:Glycoprotein precursor [Caimito virus]|uniref:Envelopment polyprotein n=1 Tax=Caimito virus TaxID=2572766 RepID=A0A4P8D7U9_9VIRU|nr:Glycoprotein precursor [Caimito virus]QCI62736.1 Glycoprotein precursor [Caimito virus]QLA46977.1 polyprotein [Caimito virus]
MILLLVIMCIIDRTLQVPTETHYCFTGGRTSITKHNMRLGPRQCIRDDVSLIKITYTKTGNDSHGPVYDMTISRKDTVKNWFSCNPKATENGPLQLLELDEQLNMHFGHYSCTKHCEIKIDKEYARIELSTSGLNYYEVLGTINQRNWVASKIHIDLANTCENLVVTCGLDTIKFHACFKQHMECNRFFKDTWIPAILIQGFCSNIELFLFFLFLLTCFTLLWLIAKTFLCYIMIPIYLPIAIAYARIYNRFLKKCKSCGLAVHPMGSCGVECVCGMIFESTDRLKRHREAKLGCKGYKSGIAARRACRSKMSNFSLALFMALFLFFFLTPSLAVQVPINDGRVLNAEDISQSIVDLYSIVENVMTIQFWLQISCLFLSAFTIFLILGKYIMERSAVSNARRCRECSLYHKRGSLCNRTCICGYIQKTGNPDLLVQEMLLITHTASKKCFLKSYKKRSKKIDNIMLLIMLTIFLSTSIGTAAEESCNGQSDEEKYACKCLENQTNDILNMSKDCLAIANSLDCSNAGKMIELLKNMNPFESARKRIDELTKMSRFDLAKNQFNANTSTWFFTHEIVSAITNCGTDIQKTANLAEVEILLKVSTPYPCKPPVKTNNEAECKCMRGEQCNDSSIKSTYDGQQAEYEHDLKFVADRLHKIIPGGYQKMLFLAITQKRQDILDFIIDKMVVGYLQSAPAASGYLKVLKKSFKEELVKKTDSPLFYVKMVKPNDVVYTHVPFDKVKNYAHTDSIKICPKTSNWFIIRCIGLNSNDAIHMLICKDKGNIITTGNLYTVSGNLCYMDQTCDVEMKPFKLLDLGRMNRLVCSKVNQEQTKLVYLNNRDQLGVCNYKNQGTCKIKTESAVSSRSVVVCGDDVIHADIKHLTQKSDSDHGTFCFDSKCESKRAFINPNRIEECKLSRDIQQNQKDIAVNQHKTLEEYLESIKTNLMQGLKTDKYVPTANLPKHVPVYKHLTLQGSETNDGITSSFVKFSMAAMTGSSAGFHIKTPSGQDLFDIVVYIVNSEISSLYDFSYITGSTKTIHSYHDEVCNENCPKSIKGKPNEAIAFFKERTSQWGCEEWGCLAINTGCVFGWCQDVILNEARVYQKATESSIKTKLCISLPTQTFCQEIEGVEPSIGETINAQLSTVQIEHFKTPVLIRDGLVYTGQINNRGSYAPICGSVQKYKKRTFGSGTPHVDYTCHAAKRKDVIIRGCFVNMYKACKMLEPYNVIIGRRTNETIQLKRNDLNLGNLEIKILLGDISFKQFAEDAEIHYKAKCAGCIDCMDGISCNIEIHFDKEISCPIKSLDCELFYHNLLISPDKSEYDIKIKCPAKLDAVEMSICGISQKVPLEIVQHKEVVEVDNNESPTYIREEDLRCGNWLCKVYNEGISGLGGLFSIFGNAYYWALGTVIAVIVLLLIVFIFFPIIKKCLMNIKEIKALDDKRDELIRRRLLEMKTKGA